MDEPENDLANTGLAALVAFGLIAVAAWLAYGDTGLAVVIVLGLGAVVLGAFHRIAGRSFRGLPRLGRADRSAPAEPVKEDTWRSERWVREAVQRGLRSLDEWRIDQQAT